MSPDRALGQSVDVGLDPSGSQLFLRVRNSFALPTAKHTNPSLDTNGIRNRSTEGILAASQAEGSGGVPSRPTMARARL